MTAAIRKDTQPLHPHFDRQHGNAGADPHADVDDNPTEIFPAERNAGGGAFLNVLSQCLTDADRSGGDVLYASVPKSHQVPFRRDVSDLSFLMKKYNFDPNVDGRT